MNTENQFKNGQKVWVEATIADDKPSPNGKILIEIQSDNTFSKTSLIRAYPERIKTTKQICDEQNTILTSQNEGNLTLDEKMEALEKIIATETERLKDWEWDDEIREWKPKTANVGGETPQEAELTEPDSTRKLEKGDNVRIVEYDGRIPTLETFMVGDIYEVATEEDVYGDVYLFDEISGRHEIVPWIFLELVELARKYKLFEKMGEYQIYDTQQGRTKASFSKEIYTFEEVQAECARLNQKEIHEN